MASGIWTAAAGAVAQSHQLESVANNLANVDTPAYKAIIPTFKEYLVHIEKDSEPTDIQAGPIKDKDFYPLDGRDQSFVLVDGTHTNFTNGHLKVTQRALDVALDGPGFIEVSTPEGIRYTRNGRMKLGADGHLVTSEGYPIMAAQEGPPTSRGISIDRSTAKISISETGEVYGDGELLAKLSIVQFKQEDKLFKRGTQYFESRDPTNLMPLGSTLIKQGLLETSNVNPIEEMTYLIKANRLFEHDLKALKTYSELMQKEANEIGKL